MAALHRIDQHLLRTDIEEGIVLAGEAGGRQVFRGGGTADGDGQIRPVLILERAPCLQNFLAHRPRQPGGIDDLAGARTGARQCLDIGLVEWIEQTVEFVPGVRRADGIAEGLSGDGEAVGQLHTERPELSVHLGKRSVLAAHQGDIVVTQLVEPANVGRTGHWSISSVRAGVWAEAEDARL
jgi:hypothetical protein